MNHIRKSITATITALALAAGMATFAAAATPAPSVAPSGTMSAQEIQTLPANNELFNLDRLDQRTFPLDGKYDYSTSGKGVTIFILDTGVKPNADLGARLLPGVSLVPGDTSTADCNGHGNHVAGLAAGTTYGVAKEATIIPVRVLGCNGSGLNLTIAQGIEWIITHKPAGPAVVNMSLGGRYDAAIENAVTRLIAAGVTVVASAGNSDESGCNNSPSRVPAVISVGALKDNDTRAGFSDYGQCVDLYAPGVGIKSDGLNSNAAYMGGTSMASPQVAGLAARFLQSNPTASPAVVTAALMDVSVPVMLDMGAARIAVAVGTPGISAPIAVPVTMPVTVPVTVAPKATTTTIKPVTTTTAAPKPTTTVAPVTTLPKATTTTVKPVTVLAPGEWIYQGNVYNAKGQLLRKA